MYKYNINIKNITSVVMLLLYSLCFEGIFCIGWILLAIMGYPTDVLGFNNYQSLRLVKCCLFPLFLFVIFQKIRTESFRSFSGMSWVMFIFLFMLYCRLCYYSYQYGVWHWLSYLFYFFLPIIAFSIPTDIQTNKYFFRMYYIIIAIFAMFLCIIFFPELISWTTCRRLVFDGVEKYNQINLSFAGYPNGNAAFLLNYCPFIGAMFSILSFWLWIERKIPLYIALPAYIPGLLLVNFSGQRVQILSWFICNLILLVFSVIKNKRYVIILVISAILITLNILVMVFYVNHEGHKSLWHRTAPLISNIVQNFSAKNQSNNNQINDNNRQINGNNNQERKNIISYNETKNKNLITVLVNCYDPKNVKNDFYKEERYLKRLTRKEVRFSQYYLALIEIYRHPWFGSAYGFLVIDTGNGPTRWNIHNNFLQAAVSTGILGCLLYICICVQGIRDFFFLSFQKHECAWIGFIFIYMFTCSLFGSRFIDYHIFFPLVIMRASVMSIHKQMEDVVR